MIMPHDQTGILVTLSKVSKSWNAAVKAYPSSVFCMGWYLNEACKSLPGMVSISIQVSGHARAPDTSPLMGCKELSSVAIASSACTPAKVHLGDLPGNVKKLQLLGQMLYQAYPGTAVASSMADSMGHSTSDADLSGLTSLPEITPSIEVRHVLRVQYS